MKSKQSALHQILVLTSEEKRTVSFILVAFLLGTGAKHYRDAHATPPRETAIVDAAKTVGLPAQKRAEAKRRKQSE